MLERRGISYDILGEISGVVAELGPMRFGKLVSVNDATCHVNFFPDHIGQVNRSHDASAKCLIGENYVSPLMLGEVFGGMQPV